MRKRQEQNPMPSGHIRISDQTVYHTTHKSINQRYTVCFMFNIINACMLQSAIGIKNSSKHVMIGCYGITQFQKHFLTTRDKSLHLLSELLERWQIRLKRNIGGINSSKSYGLYARIS